MELVLRIGIKIEFGFENFEWNWIQDLESKMEFGSEI